MLILEGESAAYTVAFTPEGTRLVLWRARCLEVCELPGGKLVQSAGPFGGTFLDSSFALHPSGRVAYVPDCGITPVSLDDRPAPASLRPANVSHMIVSPNGKWLAAKGRRDGEERLYGFRCSETGELSPAWEDAP